MLETEVYYEPDGDPSDYQLLFNNKDIICILWAVIAFGGLKTHTRRGICRAVFIWLPWNAREKNYIYTKRLRGKIIESTGNFKTTFSYASLPSHPGWERQMPQTGYGAPGKFWFH